MSGSNVQLKGETKLPESLIEDAEQEPSRASESEQKPAESSTSQTATTRSGSDVQLKGQAPLDPASEPEQTPAAAEKNAPAE